MMLIVDFAATDLLSRLPRMTPPFQQWTAELEIAAVDATSAAVVSAALAPTTVVESSLSILSSGCCSGNNVKRTT